MRYENVYLDGIVSTLPDEILTTDELERTLAPLYDRLRLPYGRLELMTGIKERRLWPKGMLPGDASVKTVERLLAATGARRESIGAFIHASVCRDYQEPATACDVHRRCGLSQDCSIFDISNACLGLLTGALTIANMIELGQIEAGIVVGTENSRTLLETTVARLLGDETLTRHSVKPIFASLTIGSGSAAMLLTGRRLTRTGNRLLGAVAGADSLRADLCRSEIDVSAGGRADGQFMRTDSEALLHAGVNLAERQFARFLPEVGWTADQIDRTFCHQVGRAHQNLVMERLGLDAAKNFMTFSLLGNTGSVALPTAAAIGIASGFASPGDRLAMLGIGSGVNVVMLAVDWRTTLTDPEQDAQYERFLAENRR
ncbi:MAG: 3-oxoacyl-ACP synthase III [Thermoguttaceae bacterium]|nr:3-oxoacyl-ACP synthase III [Thermoguttaceae bacterium]